MLVDSHCHLDFPDYSNDLDASIARARQAGIGCMLSIGTRPANFPSLLAIAERFDDVFCTIGVHPHEADKSHDIDCDRLMAFADHPKVVGFGESGLDYFYEHSSRLQQKQSFFTHIEAARKSSLPLVIHTRDADDDMMKILRDEYQKGHFNGLIHCFSSSLQLAVTALEIGFYISVSGIVTFNKSEALREIIGQLPMDRLLIETDAPFLAPVPKRGNRNEPAFVAYTAAKLAEIKDVPVSEIERMTTENFYRLFKKARK